MTETDGDLWPVRRPVRPGDADPGARRARRGLAGGARRPRLPGGGRPSRPDLHRPPLADHARVRASRPASGSTSSARTSTTRARTRSTTRSARSCSRALGKTRIIAETGAGQHGVATATACARFGLECVVFMGSEDMRRQAPNVERMHLLGATVVPVEFGTRTLKEATSEAIRDWITNVETTHYVIGSCVGPAPYPEIVRELQAVIGREARAAAARGRGHAAGGRRRLRRRRLERDRHVRRLRRRPGGAARRRRGRGRRLARDRPHSASSTARAPRSSPTPTARSPTPTRSRPGSTTRASAPSTRSCATRGRAEYRRRCTDEEALAAFRPPRATEGIIPALESSHALAVVDALDAEYVVVCLSGRGDKDLAEALAGSVKVGGPRERHDGKALVIYLMAGPETPELAAAAVGAAPTSSSSGSRSPTRSPTGPSSAQPPRRRSRRGCARPPASTASRATRALVGATPLIPMTYASLLEAYGWERFEADARTAGATSFIVADTAAGSRPELRRIQLVAPTSTDERIALAAAETDGWLYLVTLTGTTGARSSSPGRSPGSPRGHGRSPTSRSTPASGSRRPSRHARPPISRTASSSARGPSWWRRKAPTRCAHTSAPSAPPSTRRPGSREGPSGPSRLSPPVRAIASGRRRARPGRPCGRRPSARARTSCCRRAAASRRRATCRPSGTAPASSHRGCRPSSDPRSRRGCR